MPLQRFFRVCYYLYWPIFLFVLLVLPTRTGHALLGSYAETADKMYGFLFFLVLIKLIFLFCTSQFFSYKGRPANAKQPSEQQYRTHHTVLLYIQILLSVLIFARSVSQINDTLDWDEHEAVSSISSGDTWFVVNPFRGSTNHPIASLASAASMKIFGVSKWAARLPALGFAILFLILLNLFCVRFSNPFVTLTVFLHLLCNEMSVWYMHSMRGYIPMMFFTFGAFFVLYSFTQGYQVTKRQFCFFTLMLLCAPLSHTIGYLFCVVLALAFTLWLFLHGEQLTADQLQQAKTLFLVLCVALSVIAIFPIVQMAALNSEKWIISSDPIPDWQYERNFARISMVFGVARFWMIKFLSVPVLILLLRQLKVRRFSTRNFDTVFLCTSFFLVAFSVWLLKAIILEGRMMMPFLVLFVLWIANATEKLSPRLLRSGTMIYVLLFLTVPQLGNSYSLLHDDLEFFAAHETFAIQVKKQLKKDGDVCFSFDGDPSAVLYAKHFYFREFKEAGMQDRCGIHYLAYYSLGRFDKKYPLKAPSQGLSPIYEDGKGRFFYEIIR